MSIFRRIERMGKTFPSKTMQSLNKGGIYNPMTQAIAVSIEVFEKKKKYLGNNEIVFMEIDSMKIEAILEVWDTPGGKRLNYYFIEKMKYMKTYKLYGAYGEKIPANSDFTEFLESYPPGMYHSDEEGKTKGWPHVYVTCHNCNGPAWSHTKDDSLVPVQAIEIFDKGGNEL